jgi:anti-anti-sigma factor
VSRSYRKSRLAPNACADRYIVPRSNTEVFSSRTDFGVVFRPEVTGADRRMVVGVVGDVDAETAPDLLMALVEALWNDESVCVDLNAVGFFGADGVSVLVASHLHATAASRRLSMRGARGLTAWVLEVAEVDRLLTRDES